MEALTKLNLGSPELAEIRSGWCDSFMPIVTGSWDNYPSLSDFYASRFPGVDPSRTWVYAPSESVLQERWNELVEGNDLDTRAERFKETSSTKPRLGNSHFLEMILTRTVSKAWTARLHVSFFLRPPILCV